MSGGYAAEVDVEVSDRVLKPVAEVFAAVLDPTKLSRFFISGVSGPGGNGVMTPGITVEWLFADVDARVVVEVKKVVENREIAFDWDASGVKARVVIAFDGREGGSTLVRVTESGWPMDRQGVQRALGQTKGWTDFLCCMKAYLQHGINLRLGRKPEAH